MGMHWAIKVVHSFNFYHQFDNNSRWNHEMLAVECREQVMLTFIVINKLCVRTLLFRWKKKTSEMAVEFIVNRVKAFLLFILGILRRAMCCLRRRRRSSCDSIPLSTIGVVSNTNNKAVSLFNNYYVCHLFLHL